MQALRAPGGCPWDAQQTQESLIPYIMEEACELIDAIDAGRTELILDELGDLLLQVVFQAQLFDELEEFDFYAVAAGINDKLIRRHPHVFANTDLQKSSKELDAQWDAIKSAEATHNKSCLADHLPRRLPTLQRAQKLISKVYRQGRQTELSLQQETPLKNPPDPEQRIDEEALGQTLFQLVRLAHENGLDAESALRKTTTKIITALDADET